MTNQWDIPAETIDLVDRYLRDELSTEEKQSVEASLANDAVFKGQFEQIRLMSVAIAEASLEKQLDNFHAAFTPSVTDSRPAAKTVAIGIWISAVAAILVVVLAGWWFFLKPSSGNGNLYSKYYQPDPGLMTTMGGTDEYEFNRGMIEYKSAQYDSAIVRWKKLGAVTPVSDTLNYFLGVATMAAKQYPAALQYFQQVINKGNSAFLQDAYWYAGLVAINQSDKKLAIQYLSLSDRKEKDQLIAELNK